MKRCILSLVMALAALCAVTITASAAQADSDITVQLNGQILEFPDARPQVKDNRTFLPYRAVFEAMGAEVGYADDVVTARRGDTELSMTIGETTATVTRSGVTEDLTMDVAPYIDSSSWRTYVPVRFAADAFGCAVGWDQATQTVVLVDVDALMNEALAGKEFTLLEQYTEYSETYSTGNWAVNGSMGAAVSLFGGQNFSVLSGAVDGIVSGDNAGEMAMTMDLDLNPLMSQLAYLMNTTLTELGFTEEELHMSMTMDAKVDMDAGTIYIKADDASNELMGLPADAWLSLDLNDILAEDGLEWDYDAMLAQAGDIDMVELLKATLADIPLDGQADYAFLSDTLNRVFTALSDEGFQKTADGYETTLTLAVEGVEFSFEMELTTTAAGEINGYSTVFSMVIPLDEEIKADLAKSGLTADRMTMSVSDSLDKNNHQKAAIQISMAPLFAADMTVEMNYKATSQAPDTTLPASAAVVDYMDLLASVIDLL